MAGGYMYDRLSAFLVVPASILFMFSIWGLNAQKTAKMGNAAGALGMALAIASVIMGSEVFNYVLAFVAVIPAFCIGFILAEVVPMTGMPQMVGLLNSFGGLSAALASIAFYQFDTNEGQSQWEKHFRRFTVLLGVVIGVPTFTGSIVACGKLAQVPAFLGRTILLPGRHYLNLFLLLLTVVFGVLYHLQEDRDDGVGWLGGVIIVMAVAGVHFVVAIGGADMPVVIAFLNSMSGLSACAAGFTVQSDVLILTGALVGGSGAILSYVMCAAMNRDFISVMAGGFGESAPKPKKKKKEEEVELKHTTVDVKGLVKWMVSSKRILITPGYGMAVAQAQHVVANTAALMRKLGADVLFGVHPVAGRLPGHMNVLLAEANVPYNFVLEMDEVNPDISTMDLVLVIGANDTVNPAAMDDPDSAIAGMPVIHVWESKRVVVFKRTMGVGYAGVSNPLFFKENTSMLLGDAKSNMDKIFAELQDCISKDPILAAAAAGKDARASVTPEQEEELERKTEMEQKEKERQEAVDLAKLPTTMLVGIPMETLPGEKRVACTPLSAKRLRKQGFQVVLEKGAGIAASYTDPEYERVGVKLVESFESLCKEVDMIFKVNELTLEEVQHVRHNSTIVSFFNPKSADNEPIREALAKKSCTLLAMELVPRISRAQKLDALSSLANIAGYRAVVEASHHFGRFFTGQITAAGKLPPAKVLVIGAGVAGLAAIGAAKSMGAVVRAFDVRPVVKTEVESMGAEFLMLNFKEDGTGQGGYANIMSDEFYQAEMRMFARQCKEIDIVITTAQIPGRPAPRLILASMVDTMKRGSVVVDLAAASGGNCEYTKAGEKVVTANGVIVLGYTDLTSRMASTASRLYGSNLCYLMEDMVVDGKVQVNENDEVVRNMLILHNGEMKYPAPRKAPPAKKDEEKNGDAEKKEVAEGPREPMLAPWQRDALSYFACACAFTFVGVVTPDVYHTSLIVFAISCMLGYFLVWQVTPALHTPLMSVTNAISGIVVLSGLELIGGELDDSRSILAFIAAFVASINVAGGFAVTHRMLRMFRSQGE